MWPRSVFSRWAESRNSFSMLGQCFTYFIHTQRKQPNWQDEKFSLNICNSLVSFFTHRIFNGKPFRHGVLLVCKKNAASSSLTMLNRKCMQKNRPMVCMNWYSNKRKTYFKCLKEEWKRSLKVPQRERERILIDTLQTDDLVWKKTKDDF